jgi:hypothetical protein
MFWSIVTMLISWGVAYYFVIMERRRYESLLFDQQEVLENHAAVLRKMGQEIDELYASQQPKETPPPKK